MKIKLLFYNNFETVTIKYKDTVYQSMYTNKQVYERIITFYLLIKTRPGPQLLCVQCRVSNIGRSSNEI